ncbi:hypothetical protein BJ878DRAFT_412253 [Calycina marina]|uniref:C2H2-type domain-containing protein n=1 Tax=Calycina marina TaxID=1763456 RepID=A0A9P8CIQ9_9HELO|nr:hypothetical protein BJ878DRAFT_412253 [Calycina marina]
MPTREIKPECNSYSGRPSMATVASNEPPSTPPLFDGEERRRTGENSPGVNLRLNEYLRGYDTAAYKNPPPKLDRTMTDVYADELYNPSFQITSAPPMSLTPSTTLPPQNEVFMQRLQMANNQHINSTTQIPSLSIPARERSPFRKGSPLAPTGDSFEGSRFGTASRQREQMKMENDRQALVQQLARTSPEQNTLKTISPKDVNLVFQENEGDSSMPLFPTQQQQTNTYRPQSSMAQETPELDDTASQHSYSSMATSRRESSTFSPSSQTSQQQGTFNFTAPSIPSAGRQVPQQYPFVSATHRQVTDSVEQFSPALTSMESSNSDYAPDWEAKKPAGASADTGTYTCTYHGCTLRFETPAKLQRHKREGHRNSASLINGGEESGMTSAALRSTQNGPHKCERTNPSTGKPCNTIFSRPYDLTRHEDTIHNARKQKVRCHLCTEEKTFSRSDALTRHFRVCHPDRLDLHKTRRRGVRD